MQPVHINQSKRIYISSYTSTLSSLIKARSDVVRRLAAPKLLVIGQPNDNLGVCVMLPDIREEIGRVDSLGNFSDILVGEKADRQTVLDRLQDHPWVHFACHGRSADEPDEPFLSYFQLHDEERLTPIDIMKARLPNAELAFLSACHSAAIHARNTPDESIHPAPALQFCCFQSVLWAMAISMDPMLPRTSASTCIVTREALGILEIRQWRSMRLLER